MKKTNILLAVATIVAVVVFWVVPSGDTSKKVNPGNAGHESRRRPLLKQKNAPVSAVKSPSSNAGKSGGRGRTVSRKTLSLRFPGLSSNAGWDGIYRDEDGNPYPQAEQELMAAAEKAIELDDLETARALAASALESPNQELRESVVDALGWFGEDAMAELLPFMADSDEDVADAAKSHWMSALQEVEDDGVKAGIIEMSMKAITDADTLEDVADELIGIDELAAVQVVVNLIEEGGASAEAAKEVYNSITGEDWSDVDAAESWLQDNYEPDDDDDDDDNDDRDDDD